MRLTKSALEEPRSPARICRALFPQSRLIAVDVRRSGIEMLSARPIAVATAPIENSARQVVCKVRMAVKIVLHSTAKKCTACQGLAARLRRKASGKKRGVAAAMFQRNLAEAIGSTKRKIAIVGAGISGLSAAWLLARRHDVTVYDARDTVGGHSNTVEVPVGSAILPVDVGFIVYNEPCYPNLTALFKELRVETKPTGMTFSVSLDDGRLEYAGSDFRGLFAQPGNALKPRFWNMLSDLLRFYRSAERDRPLLGTESLNVYLKRRGFSSAFCEEHLYPMAAAIWSMPAAEVGQYPAATFIRFFENHGLLKLVGRPVWRTVVGGSRNYVRRLVAPYSHQILKGVAVCAVRRDQGGVDVVTKDGCFRFDQVVLATHANQALKLLDPPTEDERRLLSTFRYSVNEAILHGDQALMPRRRAAWASWNYLSCPGGFERRPCVTYWMNRLQPLGSAPNLFVTLNPCRAIEERLVYRRFEYKHPILDSATDSAQRELWSLQGHSNIWFAGAYFGSGFHEDGIQAGLAVAEELGGVRRPWGIFHESARIHRIPSPETSAEAFA